MGPDTSYAIACRSGGDEQRAANGPGEGLSGGHGLRGALSLGQQAPRACEAGPAGTGGRIPRGDTFAVMSAAARSARARLQPPSWPAWAGGPPGCHGRASIKHMNVVDARQPADRRASRTRRLAGPSTGLWTVPHSAATQAVIYHRGYAWDWRFMRFLAIFRAIDPDVAPPDAEIAAVRESFQHLASGTDSRVKEVFAFAVLRQGAMVVDVQSHEELHDVIWSLPFWRLCTWDLYPLIAPEHLVRWLDQVHANLVASAPPEPE